MKKSRKVNSTNEINTSFQRIIIVRKFGKKFKDLQNTKTIEPQEITGINRLVCTSKSHNVDLKGILLMHEV